MKQVPSNLKRTPAEPEAESPAGAGAFPTHLVRILRAYLREALDTLHPLILVLIFLSIGFGIQWTRPIPGMMRPLIYLPTLFFFLFLALYFTALIWAWFRWRQKAAGDWIDGVDGWKAAWQRVRRGPLSNRHMIRLLAAALFIPLLLNTFGSWKLAIPRWAGFARETEVMRASWALNGGVPGWHLLQPILGHPGVTWLLDRIYFTWLPVFVVMALWQSVWREPRWERRRFLLALALTWLGLGAVLATVYASAGPIFLDRLMPGVAPYSEMMDYLRAVDAELGLITVEVRELLWQARAEDLADPLRGISAFPSIHVAMVALYVLALWRPHRRLAMAAAAYTATIGVATVHLGWHYTIDVYAGILGAIVCWIGAGIWAGALDPHRESPESTPNAA